LHTTYPLLGEPAHEVSKDFRGIAIFNIARPLKGITEFFLNANSDANVLGGHRQRLYQLDTHLCIQHLLVIYTAKIAAKQD
jgi:hypothetical protein